MSALQLLTNADGHPHSIDRNAHSTKKEIAEKFNNKLIADAFVGQLSTTIKKLFLGSTFCNTSLQKRPMLNKYVVIQFSVSALLPSFHYRIVVEKKIAVAVDNKIPDENLHSCRRYLTFSLQRISSKRHNEPGAAVAA